MRFVLHLHFLQQFEKLECILRRSDMTATFESGNDLYLPGKMLLAREPHGPRLSPSAFQSSPCPSLPFRSDRS
jgi:hypothetical protein